MTDKSHITTTTVNFRDWILGTGEFSEENLKKDRDEFFAKLGKHWSDLMLASMEKAFADLDAVPEARAPKEAASDRTDKAVLRSGEGTGNTLVTEPLPVFVSGSGSVTPVSYAKDDEKSVFYDTKTGTTQPRNGALDEPAAWAVAIGGGNTLEATFCGPEAREEAIEWCHPTSADRPVPLYRHPRPTLTDEERAAIAGAADLLIGSKPGATLRKLLERTK